MHVLKDRQLERLPENVMPLPLVVSGRGLKTAKSTVCDANKLEKVAKICRQHIIFCCKWKCCSYVQYNTADTY